MAELQRKKQKSVGTVCKDAIMTGISYMIPVIVGGGVITAIAKMMGGYNIGDTAAEMQTLAQVIFTIGNNLFAFAVPCLAAFIAYAIADKPGIAPGYAMGVLAGLMKTGFVGGLVGALIAGWFVLQMKKIKVPKALQGIMPIMFIPVLSTLIVGLLMWYVIGVPIAWLMGIVTGWLTALSAGSRFVLGAVIGAMIAFDNGGPVNKTAALFVNGLNADGFFIPTSAKMCAGMTSPLGIAISTVLPWSRNKFTKTEKEQALSLVILSCCYVQEGVIPFQLKDPVRLTASICVGGAITGGLCMMFLQRATLMWAGSLSHNGLTGTGRQSDFASHKIEHELGGMFDVAHGAGLCAVWGSWARYVYKTNPARFAQFAVRVFDVPENFYDVEATALKGIEAWEDWCHKIGMPINLHELGIDPTDDQIKEMAEKCVATGGGTVGFFQPLNKDDIINIYKMSK